MTGLDKQRNLSLYLHIPFCKTKCGYCAFYSLPECLCEEGEKDKFFHTLKAQLSALVDDLKIPFYTIFVGGGNPILLGAERLHELLSIATKYGPSAECTLEINPENVDNTILPLFDFVNRVSVGIQSFDERSLKILNRNATVKDNFNALEKLKEYGVSFNGDLIACIPSSSKKQACLDIKTLASFGAEHISLYALTFEEGVALTNSYEPLEEEEQREILCECWSTLEGLGYEQYEVSNFAKGGKYCLHNQVYWSLGQYVGLGPSAESSLGYRKVISMRNKESLSAYLEKPEFDALELTKTEAEEEVLLTALRTKRGIDKQEYKMRFDEDFDRRYGSFVQSLDKSLYVDDGKHFALNREGFMLLDSVILTLAMAL